MFDFLYRTNYGVDFVLGEEAKYSNTDTSKFTADNYKLLKAMKCSLCALEVQAQQHVAVPVYGVQIHGVCVCVCVCVFQVVWGVWLRLHAGLLLKVDCCRRASVSRRDN